MSDTIKLHYTVSNEDFTRAGEASGDVKRKLKQMGSSPEVVRNVAIAMYEGEINMVIHADGGEAMLDVDEEKIVITLKDHGPGIPDVDKAMEEGWSTASSSVRAMGFGAGMGLPNMKRNADEMRIDTELGGGTTVTMVLYIGGEGA